jgi:hypothetical protein
MLSQTLTTILLSCIISFSCFCQGYDESSCVAEKGEKGTQGKKEDQWSKKFLRKEYTKKNYSIYSGVITVLNDDTIKYNDEFLIVTNTCKYLKLIFQKGILYPEIFTGYVPVNKGMVTKKELDSLSVLIRSDSLEITDFEELTFIKRSQGTKIFRFWLFRKGLMNPTVCFVALYNETADRKTDIVTFINGSKLTFFAKGWVAI